MAPSRAILVLAVLPALAAPAVSAGAEPATLAQLKTTHRLSASVEFVNRWSISTRETCKYTGSGTFTIKLGTAVSPLVTPEVNRSAGRWTILGPVGRGYRELSSLRSNGTMTREDNTVQNPLPNGELCGDPKTACGSAPARDMKIFVVGVTRRSIDVDIVSRSFVRQSGSCGWGTVDSFHNPVFFGRGARQNLRLRMPSARALRRRVVRVSDTDRKRRTGGEDEIFADDVTRKATVTFRRR